MFSAGATLQVGAADLDASVPELPADGDHRVFARYSPGESLVFDTTLDRFPVESLGLAGAVGCASTDDIVPLAEAVLEGNLPGAAALFQVAWQTGRCATLTEGAPAIFLSAAVLEHQRRDLRPGARLRAGRSPRRPGSHRQLVDPRRLPGGAPVRTGTAGLRPASLPTGERNRAMSTRVRARGRERRSPTGIAPRRGAKPRDVDPRQARAAGSAGLRPASLPAGERNVYGWMAIRRLPTPLT